MILSMLTPMIPHKIINAHNDTINAHTNDRYHIKLSMLTIILNTNDTAYKIINAHAHTDDTNQMILSMILLTQHLNHVDNNNLNNNCQLISIVSNQTRTMLGIDSY